MTWTQWPTNTNLDKMRVADLEIHKNGSQTILYVAANNRNNNAIAASANGLYKIIDNNETVSAVPVGNLGPIIREPWRWRLNLIPTTTSFMPPSGRTRSINQRTAGIIL